ncbi:hypothetical protein EMIT0P44_170105 [Pseudomonas sp. IT-P44]
MLAIAVYLTHIPLKNNKRNIYYFPIYKHRHIVTPQANLQRDAYAALGQDIAVVQIPILPTFLKASS